MVEHLRRWRKERSFLKKQDVELTWLPFFILLYFKFYVDFAGSFNKSFNDALMEVVDLCLYSRYRLPKFPATVAAVCKLVKQFSFVVDVR